MAAALDLGSSGVIRVSSNLTRGTILERSSRCECFLTHQSLVSLMVELCFYTAATAVRFCHKAPFWSVRLSARTPPFHGGKRGSIPLRSASFEGSSNGRTTDFESVYLGSNPSPSATLYILLLTS